MLSVPPLMYRSVTKEIRWECAHRLVKGYPGKCSYLHGHSWVARITVKATTGALDQYDFVQDFGDFKPIRNWVDDQWDHSTLVYKDDKALIDWLVANKQKHYVLDRNPSSEVIAQYLFEKASALLKLNANCVVEAVSIFETCTSETTYRANS